MQRRRSWTPKANAGIGYSSKVDRKPWRSKLLGLKQCQALALSGYSSSIFRRRSLMTSLRALARACWGPMFAKDRWTPTAKSDAPVTKKQTVTASCLGVGGYDHNTICLCFCLGKHRHFMLGRVPWPFSLHSSSTKWVRVLLGLKLYKIRHM